MLKERRNRGEPTNNTDIDGNEDMITIYLCKVRHGIHKEACPEEAHLCYAKQVSKPWHPRPKPLQNPVKKSRKKV